MGKLLRKVTGRAVGRYRAMGIQMVISLSFTAVAIVGMVFMGMSLFLRFSTTTYELMEDNSQRVLAQVNMNLDGYLRRMMRVSDTLYYRIIKNTDLEEGSLESGMSLLYEENRESIVSIAVFDEKGRLVSAAPLSELKPDAELRDSGWFQAAIKKMENFHFSTPHVQNLFQEQDARYRWVVSLSSQVQLTRGGATETGVLLVDMSFGGIEQICRDVQLSNGGYLYLIDGSGELIYHPRQQLIYAGLLEENNRAAAGYSDGSHRESFQGRERQVTVKTVGYTGWKLVGVVPMEDLEADSHQMVLFGLSLLLFSIFLQVLLHEGGHLVCGLATGYRFVSFRIFNLTFIRKDGKLCIKRFSLAGTGGQCLLTPPERPLEDIPTTLYNLGGVLANLLTAILAFLPLLTVDGLPYLLKFFLLMLSLIGILLAGMNGIPMKMGGIGNDADNMRLLLKDSKSKQALVTQLRINALVQEGMRPKDMPAEWFSQTEDINYKDALQVTIALMSASRLLDCEEWEAAYNAFEKIMSHRHEVIGLLIKENACELLFTALVTKRTARAEELYTDELDTYIRQYKDVTSSKQRLLCALALYRDKDTAKAKEIYEATCQRKNKYLMQGEVSSDIALMKSILTAKNAL